MFDGSITALVTPFTDQGEIDTRALRRLVDFHLEQGSKGLEAHYTAIADESDIPLILYNVPSRTSVDLFPKTVERLSRHPRIVGIKEASGITQRIDEILDRCGELFVVLSGDDRSCLQAVKHGAHGVISVAANLVPGPMAELCASAYAQDWERADVLEEKLARLFNILMIETNPIPVKWSLFEMGLVGPHIRLPMTGLDEGYHEQLRQCLHGLGLIPS